MSRDDLSEFTLHTEELLETFLQNNLKTANFGSLLKVPMK